MPSFRTGTVVRILERAHRAPAGGGRPRRRTGAGLRPDAAHRAGGGGRPGRGQHHRRRARPRHRRLARRPLEPGPARVARAGARSHHEAPLHEPPGRRRRPRSSSRRLAEADDLDGMPVVVCGLHSQVPCVAAALGRRPAGRAAGLRHDRRRRAAPGPVRPRRRHPRPRPGGRHHHRRPRLRGRPRGGQHALGPGGRPAGRSAPTSPWWRWDRAWSAPPPASGYSALEVGPILDAAEWLGGRPVAALRFSLADPRLRHQGVSHHTPTSLALATRARATIGVPRGPGTRLVRADLEAAGLADRHRLLAVDDPDVPAAARRPAACGSPPWAGGRTRTPPSTPWPARRGRRPPPSCAGRSRPPAGRGGIRPVLRRVQWWRGHARLERLLNLTAALLTAPRPLTADEMAERVPGYPAGRRADVPARLRARQGVPARDGHPRAARPRPGRRSAGRGLPSSAGTSTSCRPGARARRAGRPPPGRRRRASWRACAAAAPSGSSAAHRRPATAPPGRRRGRWRPCPPRRCWCRCSGRGRAPAGDASPTGARTASVDPWRLSFRRGHWYLEGCDHGAAAERQFRLDRIEGAVAPVEAGRRRPAGARPRGRGPAVGDGRRGAGRGPRCSSTPTRPAGPSTTLGEDVRRRAPARRLRRAGPPGHQPRRRSARSCSASSTTPRCSARPSCARTWSTGSGPRRTR